MGRKNNNDLFYTCSLIEYIGRLKKRERREVTDFLGKEEIGRKILIAIGGQTAKALKANDLHCYTCKKHSEEGFLEEIIGIKEEYHV